MNHSAGSLPQLVENPKTFAGSAQKIETALAETVYKCLEKSPADRFQSAVELMKALDPFTGVKIWSTGKSDVDPFR